jgi:flavorubredoxin
MAIELYNDGAHKCICFFELARDSGIQSNQFLIIDGDNSILLDPGGDLTYNDLFVQSYRFLFTKELDYVVGSHQDPDIISSLAHWLERTDCKILVPRVWQRFVPHFAPHKDSLARIEGIPDEGMKIPLGASSLWALPAHFLHSEGNFQFYDPVAKILFSGDLGANDTGGCDVDYKPVQNFTSHIQYIQGFHRRYMCSNKVARYWVNMVRELDIEWIVPQHGQPYHGKEMINALLDWVEQEPCGLDLMAQSDYRIPD